MDHINCNESLLEKYVLSLIKHIDTTCSLIDKASIDFKQLKSDLWPVCLNEESFLDRLSLTTTHFVSQTNRIIQCLKNSCDGAINDQTQFISALNYSLNSCELETISSSSDPTDIWRNELNFLIDTEKTCGSVVNGNILPTIFSAVANKKDSTERSEIQLRSEFVIKEEVIEMDDIMEKNSNKYPSNNRLNINSDNNGISRRAIKNAIETEENERMFLADAEIQKTDFNEENQRISLEFVCRPFRICLPILNCDFDALMEKNQEKDERKEEKSSSRTPAFSSDDEIDCLLRASKLDLNDETIRSNFTHNNYNEQWKKTRTESKESLENELDNFFMNSESFQLSNSVDSSEKSAETEITNEKKNFSPGNKRRMQSLNRSKEEFMIGEARTTGSYKVGTNGGSRSGTTGSKKQTDCRTREDNEFSVGHLLTESEEDDDGIASSSTFKPKKYIRKRQRLIPSDSENEKSSNDGEEDHHSDLKEFASNSNDMVSWSDDSNDELKRNFKSKKYERAKPKRRKRVHLDDSSSSEDEMDREKSKTSKKIARPMMSREKLQKETIDAEKAEKERRKRLEAKQREFNGIEMVEGSDLATALGSQTIQQLKSVVLDPDLSGNPPQPVAVHPSLVRCLKPHQAKGIQFLYDSTIESLDRIKDGGGGGILAHCMGLGKTLQVIAFLHTILMYPKISDYIKRVLVIVPKNVALNWYSEFQKWLYNDDIDPELATIDVMEFDSLKNNNDRHAALKNWYNCCEPSVMIIGYDMFRILVQDDDDRNKRKGDSEGNKKNKNKRIKKFQKMQPDFRKFLQNPGPDLIVCDEAHKLKNAESTLAKTMLKIRTKRRICLSGTPLQNNLLEYHCMVSFVKPGLLGTKTEFSNRFANIINRGRTKDATPTEVRFMKRRCHVLYEHLKKVVDRKDYRVLTEAIPPKQEYVINIRLTPRQIALYRTFLESVGQDEIGLSKRILPDYHILARIWTHPYQLISHEINSERKRLALQEKESDDDFIDDEEIEESEESDSSVKVESDDDIINIDEVAPKKLNINAYKCRRSKRIAGEPLEEIYDDAVTCNRSGWYSESGLVSDADRNDFFLSNKLRLLTEILKKCEEIGDKLLVFSQSIESLALIKRMLRYLDSEDLWFSDGHEIAKIVGETWGWVEGLDFMVIDGQVQSSKRQEVQNKFNDPENLRARLMLISTRAGSLGTNMVSANRVVIFDACWNPSHDTQSLFRVYRFGQTKPVYIYRFIAQGTMEELIYKRQVTKESTSLRVVDEAQIQRHFAIDDLQELYKFNPDEIDSDPSKRPSMAPPKDRLLADIIFSHKDCIVNYILHDSLFENLEGEKLTEQECQEAWDDYEKEKSMTLTNRGQYLSYENQLLEEKMRLLQQGPERINASLTDLNSDPLFVCCFQVHGMDTTTAAQITFLKKCLDSLLPGMSVNIRGGMNEFSPFFMAMVNETINTGGTHLILLNKAINTFRTVVALARNEQDCLPILRHLYSIANQFFDPMQPPPL